MRKKGNDEVSSAFIRDFAGQLLNHTKTVVQVLQEMEANGFTKLEGMGLPALKRGQISLLQFVTQLQRRLLEAKMEQANAATGTQMLKEIETLDREAIPKKKR